MINDKNMYLGSAWYPEHWDETRWRVDMELMQSARMNVVRIGEYAWSRLEPAEGRFEIDWLERAVNLAQEFGIHVVLGTPTDAPPAWLTHAHPEVLRVDESGRPVPHGSRRHCSQFHPLYRDYCRNIVTAMAQRLGQHPNVIGWQVGNEFCMHSHDDLTRSLFQQWLARKYGTLEILNRRWTTAYWSQEYSDWSQIPLPTGWPHPGLQLDFFRFQSEGFAEFQRVQIQVIRRLASPRQWITHNIHCYEDLDFTEIIRDADIASWDPYPGGSVVEHGRFGWYSDFCRTLKPRPHWIMETQPGHVNWAPPNVSLHRGALRGLAWHFYGHGAQAMLLWQWRAALNGQEQLHGTLLAADGTPRPIFEQVAQVGRELCELAPLFEGTRVESSVAVLYSYADQYALKNQRHHGDFDFTRHLTEFYAPLREMALNVDVLDVHKALDRYQLVIAPHLYSLDAPLIAKLVNYIRAGGHVLLGPRSGFKDEFNAMLCSRQPGKQLAALLGAYVEEFHTLDRAVAVSGEIGHGDAVIWAEYFHLVEDDTQVLLRYGAYNGWIDGEPAMVTRRIGNGRISYLGACLPPEMMRHVMDWAVQVSKIDRPFPSLPSHVEVCCRTGEDKEIFVVINHGNDAQCLALPVEMTDMLGHRKPERRLELPPFGVAVLARFPSESPKPSGKHDGRGRGVPVPAPPVVRIAPRSRQPNPL